MKQGTLAPLLEKAAAVPWKGAALAGRASALHAQQGRRRKSRAARC